MMDRAQGAEIVTLDRSSLPEARDEYTQAIQLWCETRDLAETLSREEIGAMQRVDRIDAQRKSIILGLAHYCRTHQRADIAPALLAVLTFLSDNDEGCARISQDMLAKLFGRSRTAVAQAQGRLKEAKLISTTRGRYASSYPVIPRAVTHGYNHIVWTVNAVATAEDSINCKGPANNSQLVRRPLQLTQSTRPPSQLEAVNCKDKGHSIVKAAFTGIHNKNSTVVDRAARVVASGIATALGSLPAAAEPPQPPGIMQPANEISGKDLADRLFDAAGGAMNRTQPMLEVMTLPRNWIAAGADLEQDILPTVRALASRKPANSISSWKFFDRAVMEAQATRVTPVAAGQAPPSAKRKAPWELEAERLNKQADDALAELRRKYSMESADE